MTIWTYVGQIINFLIFAVILYFLLYKPVRRVMKERKDEMEAELRDAEKKRAEAQEMLSEAEKRSKELEDKRDNVIKEARDQAEEQRKQIMKLAEDQARERLRRFRRIMEQEREELLAEVTDDLRDAIVEIAGAVLDDASVTLADRGLERVESLLGGMTKEDARGARDALVAADSRVHVRSAGPLSKDQEKRLTQMLGEKLDDKEIQLEVKEDASLLAGLEVTVGHVCLQAHWRGLIDEALLKREVGTEQAEGGNPVSSKKRVDDTDT